MTTLVPSVIRIAKSNNNNNNNTTMVKAKRKRVRFSREVVVEYITPRCELSLEETEDIWWSPVEMSEFRRTAKTLSKETRRSTWMIQSVEEAFNSARQVALSCPDETTLEGTLQRIEPRLDFVDWCRYGHSRRGLERWSCKNHKAARSEAVNKARKRVLEMQKCNDELVRRISERFSRSSRVFARVIGKADADALASQSFKHRRGSTQSVTNLTIADTATWKDTSATLPPQYHAICA